jgi:threonylcarbamoyladenosine tRNA methylthiotransferase MtaB
MSGDPAAGAEVLSFGCRLNLQESEAMRGLAPPGTLVVNTCAVTTEAERQARQALRRAAREQPGRPILVTGCAAQIDPAAWAALPGVVRVVGNADKLRPEAWRPGAPAAPGDVMAARDIPLAPPARFTAHARGFLTVQQGCDHRCSFCVIPFGRGPSRSVPVGALVAQARALVAHGHREIVLTGVDVTSYGGDLPGRPPLGQMVRRLLALVPDLPRLRLSSLDPAEIDDDLWHLIATEPRLMPHLHLSLQHGADLILKRMKRRHSRAQALAVARRIRALRPGTALGADLIAGFPTETEAHFGELLDLVAEAELDFLHVFPYAERPGTPAARMPQLPVPLRRERAARLREAGRAASARFFARRIGQRERVLLEAADHGHTEHFAPLRLVRGAGTRGELRQVLVTAADDRGLLAEAA